VALLRQVIHLQEAELLRLHKRRWELCQRKNQLQGKSKTATLQLELTKLSEQLAALQHRMYGPNSEKQSRPSAETAAPPKAPQKGHGPTPQPELLTLEKHHELPESKRTCPLCQRTMTQWNGQTEDSERISAEATQWCRKARGRRPRKEGPLRPMAGPFGTVVQAQYDCKLRGK